MKTDPYLSARLLSKIEGSIVALPFWNLVNQQSLRDEFLPRGGKSDKDTRLGAEHRPGSYALYGIVSASRLSRQQIRHYFENGDLFKDKNLNVIKNPFA